MTQHPENLRERNGAETPRALTCPICELCSMPTRFVGLEAVAGNRTSDLCTYECTACGHSQVNLVPRDTGLEIEVKG